MEATSNLEPLEHMFQLQHEMQKANSAKRPAIVDPDTPDVQRRIEAAMYYWNCATAEFAEFEILDKSGRKLSAEAKEEYIDILHFILSMLINVNFKPVYSLAEYFTNNRSLDWDELYLPELWTGISRRWGMVLNSLPYKIWKAYNEDEIRRINNSDINRQCHILLLNFLAIAMLFNMTEKEVYSEYLNKWKENQNRQQSGGIYER